MILQAFLIKSYCIYCSVVHLCGILITILLFTILPFQKEQPVKKKKTETTGIAAKKFLYAGLAAVLGVGLLAFGQTKSDSVSTAEIPKGGPAPSSSIQVKTVRLLNGMVPVNVGEFPVLGLRDPERVIAHLFDYTCPACRKLHPDLLLALQANQQDASLVMIPMPLDAACNPGVEQTSYQHLNACAYAELGLAVWRAKPDEYQTYDHFMFQSQFPPPLEKARAVAEELVGAQTVEAALGDPAIDELLRTGVSMFYSSAMQRKVLPILLTPENAVYGIPSRTDLTAIFTHP